MLIAECVEHDDLGDRGWEQLHRDGIGFQALHVLREVLVVEPDISRFSRDSRMPEGHAVGRTVIFCFAGNGSLGKLQLHCRVCALAGRGRQFREPFQQFFTLEHNPGFERRLRQDVLIIRELALPATRDEPGAVRQYEQNEFRFGMAPVERSSSVVKLPAAFAAPSASESRWPSVPTIRKIEPRISSLSTSVAYRLDSAETQNSARCKAASNAEARIWPCSFSSPSGICGKFFGSLQGRARLRLLACSSNLPPRIRASSVGAVSVFTIW